MPQNSPENLQDKSVEKNYSISIDKKTLKYIAGAALTLFVISGAFFTFGGKEKNNSEPKEATLTPTQTEQQQQPEIPKEAQNFVNQYGNRYTDPVSVYYAEANYKIKVDKLGSIMTDNYINNFKISTNTSGDSSELGFNRYELPLSAKEDQATSIDIFNTYTAKNLSLYMNLLAKNPSNKAKEIIDSEFRNYCSKTGNEGLPIAFSIDDKEIDKLMNTAKEIVIKYGNAANYSVADAIIGDDNPKTTKFPRLLTVAEELENNNARTRSLQSSGVRLLINIELYNNNEAKHIKENINDTQMSIIRQPNTGSKDNPADFTYISIGQR